MIVDQKNNRGLVGVYLIDGCLDGSQLGITRQPTKFQKFCARVFLGWKWASLKDLKKKDESGN